MQLRRFLSTLRHRWLSVLLVLLVTFGAVAGFTFTRTPIYQAQTSVFFSIQFGASANDLVQGSTYTQNSVASFAALATQPIVLDAVIDDLGLDTSSRGLAQRVTATAPLNTVIVEISVTDRSPQRSADIADSVAAQLSATVESLAPTDEVGNSSVRGSTVASATVPDAAFSPNISLFLAAGLLLGLLLGIALAILRDLLDTRVRNAADVGEVTDAPLLGSIGEFRGSENLVVQDRPGSAQAEAYRQIRTNLQFLNLRQDSRSIVVTSALPGEGKSTVAANLAIALAETSTRVLLVDADLRRPRVADVFGLEGSVGLTTILIGQATFTDVVQEWGSANLNVLAAGAIPPNPSELLGSEGMEQLLIELESRYDVVILDTAPLIPVTDAAILSRIAVGTIVVADARRLRRAQLTEGLAFLGQVEARLLGIVLNATVKDGERYGYTPYAPVTAGAGTRDGSPSDADHASSTSGASVWTDAAQQVSRKELPIPVEGVDERSADRRREQRRKGDRRAGRPPATFGTSSEDESSLNEAGPGRRPARDRIERQAAAGVTPAGRPSKTGRPRPRQ